MDKEQIIAEKDRILNEFLDGLIDNTGPLSNAQEYRKRAIELFLSENIRHVELAEAWDEIFLEARDALTTDVLVDKIYNFIEDGYNLNVEANKGVPEVDKIDHIDMRLSLENKAQSGELYEFLQDLDRKQLDGYVRTIIQDFNQKEMYMGIRHVMPESVEMRILINHMDGYIKLLDSYKMQPSYYNIDQYAEMKSYRVANKTGTGWRRYEPPTNLEELKAIHQRFKDEFPNKIREFIAGENNIFYGSEREGRLLNDEYYQWTGFGTPTSDMPSIQASNNIKEIADKIYKASAADKFDELAMEKGYDDGTDWFNEMVEKDLDPTEYDKASAESKKFAQSETIEEINYYFNEPVWDNLNETYYLPASEVTSSTEFGNVLFEAVKGNTPTNVVDYQDTGVGGRPFEIEGGVPVDESGNPIKSIGNADETVTIYRVVPEGVDSVNANDWVFINKGQAEEALKNANANVDGNFNLIEMEVSRGDVYPSTRGNLEMGYFPKDTPPNTTLRVSGETGLSTHSDRIRKVAQDYHKIMGYSDPEFKPAMVFNDEIGAIAADIFEQLPMFDDNAIPYYKKFIQETNMQYQTLLDAGMKFEVVDGDPYTPNRAGHQQMIADMENGVLKVLATESGFGDEATSKLNPMLAESIYTDVNGRVMLENDVFRAVHDTFGHGMRGNTFGPIGEYNAWLAHKEMYSPDARRVMTTETLGQNTFTNYGPHMRDAEGKLLSKADAGYIKPADRPFASQKVALMPEEIINVAGTVVEDASELVDTSSLNKVVELASTQPEVADGIMKSAKKVVGKAFNTLAGVLDPGDVAITAGISRLLPRLGLAAISPAALAAYVGYELSVLAIDAAQSLDKARQKQGIELLDYDNTNPNINWKQLGQDTWNEFGEISDTWSLSWKISEPIIDYAFGEYAKLQENR
jgi:hypothetical protein